MSGYDRCLVNELEMAKCIYKVWRSYDGHWNWKAPLYLSNWHRYEEAHTHFFSTSISGDKLCVVIKTICKEGRVYVTRLMHINGKRVSATALSTLIKQLST